MPALLPSWRDGAAKRAIVDFVASATEDGPGFIPAADRIAGFDNDGTLWVEQPLPPQFDFVFRKWAAEVEADPSLAQRQPYKAVIEKDEAYFEGAVTQDPEVVATLVEGFARSWAGTTPDDFDAQVDAWVRTAKQPELGFPYVELVYQPMLELLDFLKAHEFRLFVCSGGGRDFMRAFAEETWGIFRENVIGSAAAYHYVDGRIVRSDHLLGQLDLGPGKPEHIFAQTDRLPAFAGGNADVDIEMLDCARSPCSSVTTTPSASSPTRRAPRRPSPGPASRGWTVVSIKDDWTTVFKDGSRR